MAKLKNLLVTYISLVKKPANRRDIVYKSADAKFTDEKEIKITKSDPEGLVHGTVYEPNVKDVDGDWADPETIQKAAHSFLAKGANANVDENHDEKACGARVVESHINSKGAWDVVIKMDPQSETFKKVQKGELKGLSMGAYCVKSEEEPSDSGSNDANDDMNKVLKGIMAELVDLKAEIRTVKKGVDSVPKSRQLKIDGDDVKIEKGAEDGLFQEFDFNGLED